MLPFADAASRDLPIGQLLRLSLFQVSVGLASVMLLGTLNRVMIVELSVPAMIVAIMIALPVLIAPFRALIGFRSDTYRSAIGWKRVPFIWFGSLWQMGGLAVMPFALLVLSGDQTGWTHLGWRSAGSPCVFDDGSWLAYDTNGWPRLSKRSREQKRQGHVSLHCFM
jgi:hypothetical protein